MPNFDVAMADGVNHERENMPIRIVLPHHPLCSNETICATYDMNTTLKQSTVRNSLVFFSICFTRNNFVVYWYSKLLENGQIRTKWITAMCKIQPKLPLVVSQKTRSNLPVSFFIHCSNTIRITAPLWGESIRHPFTKDRRFLRFLFRSNKQLSRCSVHML